MDRLLVYENKYFKKISKINNYSIKYLGTWCLENWQTENFLDVEPDMWANKNILVEDIHYIKDFTIIILRSSYRVLKNDFKNPLTFDQFSSIYYSWTYNIIVKLLANWKLFDKSIKSDHTYIFDIEYDQVIAENLLDANMTYFYSKWNLLTISEIIKFRNIDYELLNYYDNQQIIKFRKFKNILISLRKLLQFISNYIKFKFIKKGWILYYFTRQSNILSKHQKNNSITQYVQLIYDKYKVSISKLKINNKKRESLVLDILPKNQFEVFISKFYFKLMPISLLEGINLLEKYSIKNYFGKQPTLLLYSDFLNNELLLYNLINFNKSQVYVYQHGGGFGFNNYTITEHIEKFYCNKYITWGWKNSELDIPFICPDFKQLFKIKTNKARRNICIILYDSPPFIPVFQPTIYSINYSKYLKNIRNLFTKSNYKNEIKLRLYSRNDSGIDFLNFFPKSIGIDNSSSLNSLYSKYKLYIYTYNSTGFLELWSLNIPCILFIENENWFVEEFGLKDFENLKNNYLLITNIESLEMFFNEKYKNIDIWWDSVIVQKTINTFLDIYANISTRNLHNDNLLELNSIFKLN
jgi:putative transferase (TIGR04331 family)